MIDGLTGYGSRATVRDEGVTSLAGACPPTSPDSAVCAGSCPGSFSVWGAYHGGIGGGGGWFFERLTFGAAQGILANTTYIIGAISFTYAAFMPHGMRVGTAPGITENSLLNAVGLGVPETAEGYTQVTFTTDDDAQIVIDVGHFDLEVSYANIVYLNGLWIRAVAEAVTTAPITTPEGCPEFPLLFTPEANLVEPFHEEIEYETAIMVSQDETERRQGSLDLPNRRISFLVSAYDARAAAALEAFLYAAQDKLCWVPYWRAAQYVGVDMSIGATALSVPTLGRSYAVGDGVMFWRDIYTAEVVELTGKTLTSLAFRAVSAPWKKAHRVLPAFLGRLAVSVDVDYVERSMKTTHVTFDLI